MYINSKERKLVCGYVGCVCIFAISFFLMPFGVAMKKKEYTLVYFSGALFWIGLLGALLFGYHIWKLQNEQKKEYLCWSRFLKNKEAKFTDSMILITAIGFILTKDRANCFYLAFVFLTLLSFSIGMHSVFNGALYEEVKNEILQRSKKRNDKGTKK